VCIDEKIETAWEYSLYFKAAAAARRDKTCKPQKTCPLKNHPGVRILESEVIAT